MQTDRNRQRQTETDRLGSYTRENWEADAIFVTALLYTFWGRVIQVAGLKTDPDKLLKTIETKQQTNPHLSGIVVSAWMRQGIRIVPDMQAQHTGLLHAIPPHVVESLNRHWDIAGQGTTRDLGNV